MPVIEIVAAAALSVALFIETSSWWIRGYCPASQVGLYISRSNIFLYGGRFFQLIFISSISFFIETGASPTAVAYIIAISFLAAAFVQITLLNGSKTTAIVMAVLSRALFLPPPELVATHSSRHIRNPRLMAFTMLASFFFGLGTGVPLLLAALVPEYRLSISNLGQIINAGGMLLVLFFVDQSLFRSLDRGSLLQDVLDYSYGRFVAFVLVGGSCLLAAVLGVGHQ